MNNTDKTIKNLEYFISNWNGKDKVFDFEGELYTEEDVTLAEHYMKMLKMFQENEFDFNQVRGFDHTYDYGLLTTRTT